MYQHKIEEEQPPVIYHGSRDKDFVLLIRNLLVKAKLKKKYIDILMDEESMKVYNNVFTSDSADPIENYEVYEQLGDITANKFIVWYIYRRFPKLKCPQGVKIVARLRINYGSKQSFATVAESLGFWDFITATEDERSHNKKPLLEDTFEAFIGATEYLIDTRIRNCVGYAIVYNILEDIFDKINISLKYEDLYDGKTRLKELFDYYNAGVQPIGTIQYVDTKNIEEKLTTSIVYQVINSRQIKLGEGCASLKGDAQQRAAMKALETMKHRGYIKPIPEVYAQLS